MIIGLNGNYNCQVKLIGDGGNVIINKLVSFNFMSNQYYAITDSGGIVNLKANLDEGTYNVTVSSEIARNAEWQNVEVPIDNNMQTLKMDKNGFVAIPINKKFKVGEKTQLNRLYESSTKNKVVVKYLMTFESPSIKKSAKKQILSASLANILKTTDSL